MLPSGASVVRRVPARVGLVGNPSDGYGGAVLATIVPDLAAVVTATASAGVSFDGSGTCVGWSSVDEWSAHVDRFGHGREERLASAALAVLVGHLRATRPSNPPGIELQWSTDIPRSVGLAGSSALAVGIIQATAACWGEELDRRVVAALALRAERDVLGLAAGWQDRVVQSFGRTVLVDAGRMEVVDAPGLPAVDVPGVDVVSTPQGAPVPLLVAWSTEASVPSDHYHAPLRRHAAALVEPMAKLAALARSAAAAWAAGDVAAVASALDAGWHLRQSCAPLREDHATLVELVRSCGLAATTPGSGGSVVAIAPDPVASARAIDAVRRVGGQVLTVDAG